MGSSKSNTGIGIVDQAVDTVVNQGTNKAAKNVEQAGQRILTGVGEIAKGNLNNAGNFLLETTTLGLTGGVSAMAGYKSGETATERRVREYNEKVAADDAAKAAADAQAAVDKNQTDINNIVSEMINTRKRSPGKAGTLLTTVGAGGAYGPLLTGRS